MNATDLRGTSRRAGLWTRVATRGAAAVVAGVAGAASFEHIASVAIAAGERARVGYSLQLAIDGLIVVGVAALLEDQRRGRHGRSSARLAVLVGVTATLAATSPAPSRPGPPGWSPSPHRCRSCCRSRCSPAPAGSRDT